MARLKRTSPALDKATMRISGMRSIDETLDLGNSLSLTMYEAHFKALQMELLDYNTMLASIDAISVAVKEKEATLRDYSERMLMGVTSRYGRGSLEYLQAGGKVRKAPAKRSASVKESVKAIAPAETSGMVLEERIGSLEALMGARVTSGVNLTSANIGAVMGGMN